MATISIIYPSGHPFDLDYYMNKHMPLVAEKWGPVGLLSWEITELAPDAPYQVQAVLHWKSLEHLDTAAAGPAGKEIFADLKNFTTAQPLLLKGTQKGKSVL